jgi:DNA-directed RNA polymerase subunit RPC12/RpoP
MKNGRVKKCLKCGSDRLFKDYNRDLINYKDWIRCINCGNTSEKVYGLDEAINQWNLENTKTNLQFELRYDGSNVPNLRDKAADELDRLEALNAELVEALVNSNTKERQSVLIACPICCTRANR